MDHFEIDTVEVTDSYVEVTYWISNVKEVQQVAFKLSSFEKWLIDTRNISLRSYWDHWDTLILNELDSVILYQDMKHYLWHRFEMLKPNTANSTSHYLDRKPMKRVSSLRKGAADSESA